MFFYACAGFVGVSSLAVLVTTSFKEIPLSVVDRNKMQRTSSAIASSCGTALLTHEVSPILGFEEGRGTDTLIAITSLIIGIFIFAILKVEDSSSSPADSSSSLPLRYRRSTV